MKTAVFATLVLLLAGHKSYASGAKDGDKKAARTEDPKWYLGAELFNGYSLAFGRQHQKRFALEASIEKTEYFGIFQSCAIGDELTYEDLAAVAAARLFLGGNFNIKAGGYFRSLTEYCGDQKKDATHSAGLQLSIGNRWIFNDFYIGGDWIGFGLGEEIRSEEENTSTGRLLSPRLTVGILF